MYPIPTLGGSYSGRSRHSSPVRYLDGVAARYNSSLLTKAQWLSAQDGIKGSTYDVHCMESKYFVFSLTPTSEAREPMLTSQIKIGPMGSRHEYPDCTCPEYRVNKEACRHMFWLFDRILDYRDERSNGPDDSFALRKDGHGLSSHMAPHNQIHEFTLRRIAEARRWAYSGEEGRAHRSRREVGDERWPIGAQATDTLLHFDQASEYSASLYSDEYLSGSPSLSGAVYRLAISNPEFLADLRKEAPVEACTRSYFKRFERRIDGAFQRWINYTKTGQPRLGYNDDEMSDPNDGFGAPNSVWLCYRLQKFAHEIGHAVWQRGPLPQEAKERAFGLLIKILTNVLSFYDVDLNQVNYRPRNVVTYNETDLERNIYGRLIVQPGRQEEPFVLNVMKTMPEAGVAYYETLMEHHQMIQETAGPVFIQEYNALCRSIQRYRR